MKCALHGSTGPLIWSLQTMITEAKQSQAAFKRCNNNKQACTSLLQDSFIAAMAWK